MRSRPPKGSLVRRLIWLAAGWSLALLLCTGVALSIFFARAALSRFENGLIDVTDALYAGSSVGENQAVLAPALTDARALRAYSGRYWQISEPANRTVVPLVRSRSLWDSAMAVPPDLLARIEKSPGKPVFYDALGPAREKLRAVAVESRLPGKVQPVLFMAAEDRGPVDSDIQRFALVTAFTLALLGAGVVAAVVIQVRVGLSPLFAMGREVSNVRQGKAERVVGSYPEELAPLAGELNALLDHNQDVVERQRTHVGNLAHALKTPISVMLAEAETAAPSALAEVVGRQAEAMRGHVEHHLRRARAAARSQGSGERTPVEPVLDEISRTLAAVYRRVDLDCDAGEGLAFAGERQDLLEMAGNLMENACKFSRGQVLAKARMEPGRILRLTVEDDGPGLKPEQRAAVLKRGERLDESAPGSGLGLSIVDELARAYGGHVELANSDLGGLKVILDLPGAEA